MGTNKTRNSIPSSTTKDRLNFTTDLRWQDANKSWDDSDPTTWDDAVGPPHSTVNSTSKSRQSIPSSSNKTRN